MIRFLQTWNSLKNFCAKADINPFKSTPWKHLALQKDNHDNHAYRMWAYGDAYIRYIFYECDAIDLMHAWNKRHGDKLKLKPSDTVRGSEDKIRELYKDYINGMYPNGTKTASEVANFPDDAKLSC